LSDSRTDIEKQGCHHLDQVGSQEEQDVGVTAYQVGNGATRALSLLTTHATQLQEE